MTSLTETSRRTLPAVGAPDAVEELLSNLETTHTKPLWAQMSKLNPPLPNPTCIPHKWAYDDIRPHLIRAGELITEKQAERRVLMLINPAREAPYTTDTVYAGLQLVMPHETAPAHRHVAFALRFIIEGRGGFTAVQGQRIAMQRGDVILTPPWDWHDHGKDGADEGPMIWLDGLDLPSFVHFPVHFVEHYKEKRYPAVDVDVGQSPIVFPWVRTKQQLDEEEGSWVAKEYLNGEGKPVSKTLGGRAERLNAGTSSPPVRETASSVYHVIEGSGHTLLDTVDGGTTRIDWKRGDTFCIPAWYRYAHFADGGREAGSSEGETVYLYRFDDRPMLDALGFYRREQREEQLGKNQ